jgi:hypothetical protein
MNGCISSDAPVSDLVAQITDPLILKEIIDQAQTRLDRMTAAYTGRSRSLALLPGEVLRIMLLYLHPECLARLDSTNR